MIELKLKKKSSYSIQIGTELHTFKKNELTVVGEKSKIAKAILETKRRELFDIKENVTSIRVPSNWDKLPLHELKDVLEACDRLGSLGNRIDRDEIVPVFQKAIDDGLIVIHTQKKSNDSKDAKIKALQDENKELKKKMDNQTKFFSEKLANLEELFSKKFEDLAKKGK